MDQTENLNGNLLDKKNLALKHLRRGFLFTAKTQSGGALCSLVVAAASQQDNDENNPQATVTTKTEETFIASHNAYLLFVVMVHIMSVNAFW